MKKCIICRKNRVEFTDEHVIPDSINGYYHIYTVCKNCNSILGQLVDEPLTNHKFMEFQRFSQQIAGKKGKVPNPFDGLHSYKDDPSSKVQLRVDQNGGLLPYLIPNIPVEKGFNEDFSILIDKQDEKNIDKIISKICKRNGIDTERVTIRKGQVETKDDFIVVNMNIDLLRFKMGLLKIGYEFATDTIKNYFLKDPTARTISNVLHKTDFKKLDEHKFFLGSGLEDSVLKPFKSFIEFKDDFHYLILVSNKDVGLICFINLFNIFTIGICLSKKEYYIPDSIIIGINDTNIRKFKKLSMSDIINTCYSSAELRFKHYFNNQVEDARYNQIIQDPDFKYYSENGEVPLYFKDGKIAYKNCEDKINQKHLIVKDFGDFKSEIITNVLLDEELYVKVLPTGLLIKVIKINVEKKRVKDHP